MKSPEKHYDFTLLKKLTVSPGTKLCNTESPADLATWIGIISLALIDEEGYIRSRFIKELTEGDEPK